MKNEFKNKYANTIGRSLWSSDIVYKAVWHDLRLAAVGGLWTFYFLRRR